MDNNALKVFESAEFGSVRTVMKDGQPWFAVGDVCEYFGVTNRNRVMQNIDAEDKGGTQMNTPSGVQTLSIVNESGLYALLFALQPQKARGVTEEYIAERNKKLKAFKRWVTHEVLPSIRATGAYMTDDAIAKFLADPDATIKLMVAYRDTAKALTAETQAHGETKMLLAERDATIKENEPKVLFADAVADSDGCISIGELAKIIAQNGVDIGRNRLFKLLRDDGYLMCGMTEDFNTPTQKSIRHGWMRVKESTYYQGNNRCIQKTPRITGKGQLYFVNKYAKKVG